MKLTHFAASDAGLKRTLNEDSFIADPETGFFAVADGMGGHTAGEIASRIAIETIHEIMKNESHVESGADSLFDPALSNAANLLKSAIIEGNRKILALALSRGELRGMGTTIVAAKIKGDSLAVGFVGDSRAYLIRNGNMHQITVDHSWVNEQIKNGLMKKSEAEGHPLRNVITRALGINEEVTVDVIDHTLLHEDILVLCSDGLNTCLTDREILESVLACRNDLHQACDTLIKKANSNGGEDNITVILIQTIH